MAVHTEGRGGGRVRSAWRERMARHRGNGYTSSMQSHVYKASQMESPNDLNNSQDLPILKQTQDHPILVYTQDPAILPYTE